MSTDFWNQRYAAEGLVYGDIPNDFLAEQLARFNPRSGSAVGAATLSALDLGAGEGRNALYLASLGFDTLAVDQSTVGLEKAQRRAQARALTLRTQAADLADFNPPLESFDLITSIFVHLPTNIRAHLHARIPTWLKPRGLFILEAYAPEQLTRNTGGPKDPTLLAPLDVIVAELHGLTIEHQARLTRVVAEGVFHTGEAEVVQVVARKG
jgi:SAM-dependent methyltransferase